MFDIPEELKKLPRKPGVYLMKNSAGEIIYVGKAINLRNRVRQYFQSGSGGNVKVAHMVGHIAEFEYIITDNELEALILERNLIKTHHPKYNIMLKDDKNLYPYLKLTVNESFPRLFMTRRHMKDRAKYYGPYTSGGALRETLELVHKIWPLRRCSKKFPREPERACLNYHIGLCMAPCAGNITEEEYGLLLSQVSEFLNGKRQPVLDMLEKQMTEASEAMEFEKAAELRDTITAVRMLDERQKLENAGGDDRDVIALFGEGDTALAQVFFIRGGKLLGRENYALEGVGDAEQTLCAFIKQFYGDTTFIPKELILAHNVADHEVITEWLSSLRGHSVAITVPQRGEKLKLVQLAATNAEIAFRQLGERIKREQDRTVGAVREIAAALGLEELRRIEAYDISNTQGYESTGSMVVFDNGRPKRSDYRKFKIKEVVGANDYAAMQEVVRRRFMRYKSGNEKFSTLPDILLIDGGAGQVSAVEACLREMEMELPVCGMVKDDRHRTRGLYYTGNEISLPYTSEGFKLLTRIQDEVHRFAIEYHRKLRTASALHSVLDDIPGIGPARRKSLMRFFGGIEEIQKADVDTLERAPAMNRPAAEAVYKFFRGI